MHENHMMINLTSSTRILGSHSNRFVIFQRSDACDCVVAWSAQLPCSAILARLSMIVVTPATPPHTDEVWEQHIQLYHTE
jgi:hypothetical protein